MRKNIICCVLVFVFCMALVGCSEDDLLDQVANVAQAEDEHVLAVRQGAPVSDPNQTYGEAFEAFLASLHGNILWA